jgi:hypothetical protein
MRGLKPLPDWKVFWVSVQWLVPAGHRTRLSCLAAGALPADQLFVQSAFTRLGEGIDRAELGEFDALVLGLLLIGHAKG